MNHQQTISKNQELMMQQVWRGADAVCFDVDSTVCTDEAIDELAVFCGVERQVKELTNRAMGGGMTFRTALTERLKIIAPTQSQIEDYINQNPPKLTPGIKQLVNILHELNIPVYLVSGGFQSIIEPVAEALGIPSCNIFANRIKFYFDGDYAGFDESAPTSSQGGKTRVCSMLKNQFGYQRLVMVGDGATDMEAYPPADAFIGFGGNAVREQVKKHAKWYVTDFSDLINHMMAGVATRS